VKPKQSFQRYHVLCVIILLGLCAALCGCVGATRLPVRATGPAGTTIQKKEIDLGFLQVGATHREEVANKLADIDTSYSNPRLFWGRWGESRWGYWWVVGYPCDNCGVGGDAKRIWHVQNVLVAFDEKGVVTSREPIGDDSLLWRALHSRMVEAPPPPLDLSQPVRVPLTSGSPAAILLTKEVMEFESSKEGQSNVAISALKVVRFTHGSSSDKKASPGVTCHALELSEKTAFGKKIKFCANAAQVGVLFQYLQQAAPPGMTWQ
jgi:hypothetical protein